MTDYQTLLQLEPVAAQMSVGAAQRLTNRLLIDKGLTGWTIRFNTARRTAGTCNHAQRVITLSKYLLAQRSYEDSLQTITHEVAHALTPGHSHDYVWQRKHREMGGNGQRCFAHVDPKAPYSVTCCEQTYTRYRAVPTGCRHRCPRCRGIITFERKR